MLIISKRKGPPARAGGLFFDAELKRQRINRCLLYVAIDYKLWVIGYKLTLYNDDKTIRYVSSYFFPFTAPETS